MSQSSSKSTHIDVNRSPISSRTNALAKILHAKIDVPEYEEHPSMLEKMIEEEGLEGTILYAQAFSTSQKWSSLTPKLRSMLHRIEANKMSFLEMWLEICSHKEETLRALYERGSSFIHAVWKRNVGKNIFQIHHDGVQQFALGREWVALAHNRGVTIYSIHTAAHVASIVLHSIERLCFADKKLYVISMGELYCWDGERCSRIPHVQPHYICAYAGWVAVQDIHGRVFIMNEDFSYAIPQLCSVLEFCHRGLALALGMEDGSIFLCYEGSEQPLNVSIPSKKPITALFWEDKNRLWIGDEEGSVWIWDGGRCTLFRQYYARIMAIGTQKSKMVIVTIHGQVFCDSAMLCVPEPFSVQVHETLGVVGLFPRHRFCQFIPDDFSSVDRAYLVDGSVWLFHDQVERISCEKRATEYSGELPEAVFSSMGPDTAIDIQGGIWHFDFGWKNTAHCIIQDIQKSWFYKQEIFILGANGLYRYTLEGRQLEFDTGVVYSSIDGVWRMKEDGTLLHNGLFQRHFAKIPSHMIVVKEYVVISQGAILSVYHDDRQSVLYHAHDIITCLTGVERYVVVACQSRCVEVIDILSKKCVGRYSTSSAVIKVTMDARLRILIHQADGSVALVVLDGVHR